MASPNLSEIVTTTLRNRSGVLADNVTKNNALLSRLSRRGKIKPFSGGRTIVQELEYAENGSYKRYSGYELLNITPSDVITAAEFDIKQAAVSVSISGLEQLQNAGEERVLDLLESRIGNAERTFTNYLSNDCYSDGTADSSKQIGGLQLLVADTPTSGTVGGISRTTYTFWRNYYLNGGASGAGSATSTNIQANMNQVLLNITRGADRPDLIIADNTMFNFFWKSLQAIQRVTEAQTGEAGFMTLKYAGIDCTFDGGYQSGGSSGSGAPAGHMYFLNTDYIFLRPHRERNMSPLDPDRFATNQDAMVKLIGWAGNMTMSNAFLQGVLSDD